MKNTTNVYQVALRSTLLATFALTGSACARTGFQADGSVSSQNSKATQSGGSTTCSFDPVDYNLGINVFAFQMTTNDGLTIGFDPAGTPIGVALGVSVQGGDLALNMNMTNPNTGYVQPVQATSHLSKTNFSFKVTYDMIGVGANFGGQTSVRNLTAKGVQALMAQADGVVAQDQNPWSTRVTRVLSANTFEIPVGSAAGLLKGDKLAIYDYTYDDATPNNACAGEGRPSALTPIAIAVPLFIQPEKTTMLVLGIAAGPIKLGDGVQVSQFDPTQRNKNRSLKRAVRLTSLTQSQQLTIEGAGQMDMVAYLQNIAAPTINASSSNYWVAPPKEL